MKREQRGNTRFSVFTERTVRSILKNPVYAGKIAYGRRHTVKVEGTNNETKVVKQDDESKIILVEGVHEAIVTPEIFAKAETRLGENVRHRKTRSDSTTVYPLTGLIRCPDCGKNIFGYTAPPRPRKNGKEGFYPRYISYRCISGRDRNGISCSLANKYYSGTKLEKEVRDVVASMVSIPEFIELVSKKVDCATDLSILKKKRESIKAEYTKYYNNLMVNEKRLAELDTGDKHYDRRVDSLNRVMDDLYEKIDDSQSRLDELDNEIAMAEKSTLTKQSIFEMLEGFSKYYDVMKEEKLQAMIKLYGENADGQTLHCDLRWRKWCIVCYEQQVRCSFAPTETKAGCISQVKRKCGIEVGKNLRVANDCLQGKSFYLHSFQVLIYLKMEKPQCPEDKESATEDIVEALKHFKRKNS